MNGWRSAFLAALVVFHCACRADEQIPQLGQPVELKLTALDGTEVDITRLRGKVVLIDFWATWCGPCVRALPSLKAAYAEYHAQGLEIVGVSFDSSKGALRSFIERHELPWPQYFDGGENKIGKRFGIESIPAMWLIDRQGKLRHLEAHENLTTKIKSLITEPATVSK